MRLALIGYGNVGRAFARLLEKKRAAYPFRIVALRTGRHGSAHDARGLPAEPGVERGDAFDVRGGDVARFDDPAQDRLRQVVVPVLDPGQHGDEVPALPARGREDCVHLGGVEGEVSHRTSGCRTGAVPRG